MLGRSVPGGEGLPSCPHWLCQAFAASPSRATQDMVSDSGQCPGSAALPQGSAWPKSCCARSAGMSFVPAVCPCCHKMGTSSRGALSGPGRGC